MPLTSPSSAGGARRAAVNGVVIALVMVIAGGIAAGVWWAKTHDVARVADRSAETQPVPVAAAMHPISSAPIPALAISTAAPAPQAVTVIGAPAAAISPVPEPAPAAKPTPPTAAAAQANARVPFDAQAFAADPVAWCAAVEPGRIWTVADPAPGIIALRPVSPVGVTIPADGSTTLQVQAVAGAPVTFASAHYGAFANGEATHSVIADTDGVATAVFTAIPGTVAFAQITAASPLTSGQVGFTVEILPLTRPAADGTVGDADDGASGPKSPVASGAVPPIRSGPVGPPPPSSPRLHTPAPVDADAEPKSVVAPHASSIKE